MTLPHGLGFSSFHPLTPPGSRSQAKCQPQRWACKNHSLWCREMFKIDKIGLRKMFHSKSLPFGGFMSLSQAEMRELSSDLNHF